MLVGHPAHVGVTGAGLGPGGPVYQPGGCRQFFACRTQALSQLIDLDQRLLSALHAAVYFRQQFLGPRDVRGNLGACPLRLDDDLYAVHLLPLPDLDTGHGPRHDVLVTDDLNDPLLDPDMRRFLRQEFGNGYESRVRTLREKYGITTEEALGVITREQMVRRE